MNINKKIFRVFLIFIPAAYISYLFHEFGHWFIGEFLGNDMALSLNYAWPKSGAYISESHNLYVLIGGPAFTIILAILSLIVIEKYATIYAYPFVFFQMFMRFFSLGFGGFEKQDEAKISAILEVGNYTVAIIVLLILFLIVWRASYKLRIDLKLNSKFLVAGVIAILLVIGTYEISSF